MRNNMYWGLGVLILLIGVSAVLLMRTTDTEPITIYRGDTEPLKDNPPLKIETAEREQVVAPQPTEQSSVLTETESSAETTETVDVPVSPHGFGPYPEVPADFPGGKLLKSFSNTFDTFSELF